MTSISIPNIHYVDRLTLLSYVRQLYSPDVWTFILHCACSIHILYSLFALIAFGCLMYVALPLPNDLIVLGFHPRIKMLAASHP